MSFFDVPNQRPVQQARRCCRVVLRMTAISHPTDRRHPIATLNRWTEKNMKEEGLSSEGGGGREGTRLEIAAQVTQSNVKGRCERCSVTLVLFLKNSCNGNEQAIVAYFSSWDIGLH